MSVEGDEIQASLKVWREGLVGLTRANRLIKFNAPRTSSLRFDEPDSDSILAMIEASRSVRVFGEDDSSDIDEDEAFADVPAVLPANSIRVARPHKDVGSVLRNLMRRANTEYIDKGLSVLYVAFGILRWEDVDGTAMTSPLVLVPVTLIADGPKGTPRIASSEEEAVINPALALRLRDFNVELPVLDDGVEFTITAVLGRIRDALEASLSSKKWEMSTEVHISTFSFSKEAMYKDLLDNEAAILDHPIVRALATSDPRKQTDAFHFDATDPAEIDRVAPPESTPLVLDADSSQRSAVHAAVAGKSFVMDGPPGTGKSQTIANMIGALLHAGKTVLFVSEKMAALDVVRNRLTDVGLGTYLLELHSHKASRREVATQLVTALNTVAQPGAGLDGVTLDNAQEQRTQLNKYAAAMNRPREPFRRSLHDVIGQLALLSRAPIAPSPSTPPRQLSFEQLVKLPGLLSKLSRSWRPVKEGSSFLWRDATDRTSLEVRLSRAKTSLDRLSSISEFSRELADALNLVRLDDLAAVASILDGHHGKVPVDSIASLLTIDDYSAVTQARDELTRTHDALAQTEANLSSAFGVEVEQLPEAHVDPELWNPTTGVHEPLGLSGARAPELHALISYCERHSSALAAKLAEASRIASAIGIGEIDTYRDLERLVEVIKIRDEVPRLPRSWMDKTGADAAEALLSLASTKLRDLSTAEGQARSTYTDEALSAPLADLEDRFSNLHTGLKKLSGAYRSDKRAVAALLVDAATVKDGIAQLSHAVRWANAAREFTVVDSEAGKILGDTWDGRASDIDEISRQLEAARRLAGLFPEGIPAPVASEFCDRDADRTVSELCGEIASVLDAWRGSLSLDSPFTAPASLVTLPVRQSIEWLDAHRAKAVAVLAVVTPVDTAIGRECGVLTVVDVIAARDAVVAARTEHERARSDFRFAFPDAYEAAQGALDRLPGLIDHAAVLRDLSGGALSDSQIDAIRASRPNPVLGAHVETWIGARDAILDAFAPGRRDELRREMDTPADALALLDALEYDSTGQDEWFAYLDCVDAVQAYGLGQALDFCISERFDADTVPPVLNRSLLRAWVDGEYLDDDDLRPALGPDRDALVESYRELDRQLIAHASATIIRAANTRRPANTSIGEPAVIQREGLKQKRHIPVRDLIDIARTTVQAIKPVFMMSPLAVSQYLPSDLKFDVVIFDEASQVTPADAVNCVYRGRALILAGDDKQLPPTSFFDRIVDDESLEEETDAKDFQSVLELAKASGAFNNLGLRWHYRSRHEDLIAFSNYKFYEGKLITYPSAVAEGDNVGVKFFHAHGTYRRGGGADNPLEAQKVAERVIEHYTTRPDLTLGVVTFSVAQADAVQAALDEARQAHRDLDGYFDVSDRLDGFFIRSLESVQGDERDVIIFSIGYGPDEAGKITTNFGVLNKDKGWRRLNVGITRARQRVEVVASLRGANIPPSTNESVEHLRSYLEYAERGKPTLALQFGDTDLGPESPFEESVIKTITAWGYKVQAQVGAAGYRIDIGVRDPAQPGRYALAVECDGYQYHSAPAARDRDRLRDEILTGLGWRMHRIWGTAWYRNRPREEERLRAAIETAIAEVDTPIDLSRFAVERPAITHEAVDEDAEWRWVSEYETSRPHRLPHWVDPGDPDDYLYLVDGLTSLAEVEGPIHLEVALERLRDWWSIGRVSARMRSNIVSAIGYSDLSFEDDFLDIADREVRAVRARGAISTRKAEHVHLDELGLAVHMLVRDAGGAPRDEVVTTVARVFGWARTSAAMERRISDAVDAVVHAGLVSEQEGNLRVSEGSAAPSERG
ncbi:DUF4011 domain-containing protein [Demequina sp. NBRC 110057]|uniref:DUF4011 domain-containing protein n=1 Tax=Demequina sp. NBRC 110057 TaxID=1570346 RepID=UPI0009FCB781|nr:DUF4011 domain-containing protein [Demequina sp. NBRC 110057]